jgi:Zn-finger nucleic acid-binding protein
MDCINNHGKLEKILFHNVEVDYCPKCMGIWFEQNELRLAKDDKDEQLNWLDVDLWRDKARFKIFGSKRYCPACRIALCEVRYDESHVKLDFCKNCQGIWLDRGEFKQIIVYLKKKFDYEILNHYTKNLVVQLWEVFTGPETLREELGDFLMLLKLLNYKFAVQHPYLMMLINDLEK